VRDGTVAGLGRVLPCLESLSPDWRKSATTQGGVIFAWGSTDIDDPASRLHSRSAVGVFSQGRYHSVDTGKLTMAPLFAMDAADRVCGG
jgi:hypothetical protein